MRDACWYRIWIRYQLTIHQKVFMVLNLFWEFSVLWKNLVFLIPFRIQRALDFCLQHISTIRVTFSSSMRSRSFSKFSSLVRGQLSSNKSSTSRSFHNLCILSSTLPNSSSFHFFKSSLKAFNLLANWKQGKPWKWWDSHFLHKTLGLQSHILKAKRVAAPVKISPLLKELESGQRVTYAIFFDEC